MTKPLSFPIKLIRSNEQIEKEFLLVNHTIAEDPTLHFTIALSKQWKMMDISIETLNDDNPLVTLALFRRTGSPEAEIEVTAAKIPREVDPANWLALHLKNHYFKILQMRRLPSPTGDVGDTLSELTYKSRTSVARSLAIKDDSRVFAVHGQVEAHGYEKVAEEFYIAISKFNLLNRSNQKFAEPMKPYIINAPIKGEFLFPKSWAEQPDSDPPPKGTSFSLINLRNDNWAGQFTFAAIRRRDEPNYKDLFSNYLGQLNKNGIEVELSDLEPMTDVAGFKKGWAGVLSASNDNESLEIRCCILEHSDTLLMFAMIGPDWESDAEAQSVNFRAFRISLETLSIKDGVKNFV